MIPNKEEFYYALKHFKFFETIKQGIKACKILRQKKNRMIPIKAINANIVAEENAPLPSTPARTSIHPVAVVPMFAPIIMPMALASFMIPEFTKPTTMTVVAEEDCMTAVTREPSRMPLNVVDVSLPRMVSNLLPATRLRPSPRSDMPKRKKPRPPKREITFAMVIVFSCLSLTGGTNVHAAKV